MNTVSTQHWCNHSIFLVFNLAVQFDIGMGHDPPVTYSRSQGAIKFLKTKPFFHDAIGNY